MKEYTIQMHSGPVTVLLSDEDAKARGLTKAAPKKEAPEDQPAEEKAATPANKSRTPANKAAAKRAELAAQAFTKQ